MDGALYMYKPIHAKSTALSFLPLFLLRDMFLTRETPIQHSHQS